ncbi:MAG: HAMP domain-containing histidine kinase [Christensenellaceae bacterium]|jgi:signal transduction histidine kinase|nr:HAMP domain-containing histidine kinase [Christensenellaceae bacterium]
MISFKNYYKQRAKTGLAVNITGMVFTVLLLSVGSISLFYSALYESGVLGFNQNVAPLLFFMILLFPSAALGSLGTALLVRVIIKPLTKLAVALSMVKNGDYSVRLPVDKHKKFVNISKDFNEMVSKLSEVETLRDDFITNFTHEFKTPIVSMRGFAKLLKKGNLSSEDQIEYLDIIIDESERLTQLATNILLLSKIDRQSEKFAKKEFSLDEQLRQCVLLLEQRWSAKNINLEATLDEFAIIAIEDLLHQVWYNLIGNAIKFTPENGTILVTLKSNMGAAVVTVSDTGCGMDAKTQKRIFDKFFQGDRSHTTEGNGLGLTITKKIIHLHGGLITVRSDEGKGTTFTIVLPGEIPG